MKNRTHTPAFTIETLEERRLMTFVPTDMVDLAFHYPTKVGHARLYLNFDGGTVNNFQSGNKARTVDPYVPPAGVDRAKAIQDIVYRTSQIFPPFNVRVMVKNGAGTFGQDAGATTIFVGDSPDNVKNGVNVTRAFVPSNSSDHPGDIKGYGHKPNSDNFATSGSSTRSSPPRPANHWSRGTPAASPTRPATRSGWSTRSATRPRT